MVVSRGWEKREEKMNSVEWKISDGEEKKFFWELGIGDSWPTT